MKHPFIYTALNITLAAIFLLFGTGYNSVIYCCADCKDAGIEAIATSSCECVHHHHHHHHESQQEIHQEDDNDNHICDFQEHHKSCEFERISVDTPVFPVQIMSQLSVDLPLITLFLSVSSLYSGYNFTKAQSLFTHYPPDNYSKNVGRLLLTKKSVLII